MKTFPEVFYNLKLARHMQKNLGDLHSCKFFEVDIIRYQLLYEISFSKLTSKSEMNIRSCQSWLDILIIYINIY